MTFTPSKGLMWGSSSVEALALPRGVIAVNVQSTRRNRYAFRLHSRCLGDGFDIDRSASAGTYSTRGYDRDHTPMWVGARTAWNAGHHQQ